MGGGVVQAVGLCWAVWGARSFVSFAGHEMDMEHTWMGSGGAFGAHCVTHDAPFGLCGALLTSLGIGMDAVRTWGAGERFGWQVLDAGVV